MKWIIQFKEVHNEKKIIKKKHLSNVACWIIRKWKQKEKKSREKRNKRDKEAKYRCN